MRDFKYSDIYNVYKLDSKLEKKEFYYRLTELEYLNYTFTCNLYASLRQGKGQRVISISLFGQSELYYAKLKAIIETIRKIYPPEWTIRIYYDNSVSKSIICDLECYETNALDFCHAHYLQTSLVDDHANVAAAAASGNRQQHQQKQQHKYEEPQIRQGVLNASYISATIWRFLPIGDSFVDVFASRDADSLILQREVDSVNAWLASNKSGHIMRDNPYHSEAIVAGMWGFRPALNRSLAQHIFKLIMDPTVARGYNPFKPFPKCIYCIMSLKKNQFT